ncbi:gamma interferon inducible lysosomal thiol reductase-domain-containing protein, partial [Baffinella frigidus]
MLTMGRPLLLGTVLCLLLCGAAHGSETSDAFAAERKALAAASLRAKAQAIKAQELKRAATLQQASTSWDDDTDAEGNDDDVMAYVRGDPPAAGVTGQVGVFDYKGASSEAEPFSPLKWFMGHLAKAVGAPEETPPSRRARVASWHQAAAPRESSWDEPAPGKASWDEPSSPGKEAFERSEAAVQKERAAARRAKGGNSKRGAAFSAGFMQGVAATGAQSAQQQAAMAQKIQKEEKIVGRLEDVVHSLEGDRRARNFEKTRVAAEEFEKTRAAAEEAHEKAAEDAEENAEAAEAGADRVRAAATHAEQDAVNAKTAEEGAEAEYEAAKTRIEKRAQAAWTAEKGRMRRRKVRVEVYVESMCPGCKSFIRTDLSDLMDGLGKYVHLENVPYGNAWFNTTSRQITCQHGPTECEGNRIELCLMKLHPGRHKWFPAAKCLAASNTDPRNASFDCFTEAGIDREAVLACSDGIEGEILHTRAGNETLSLIPPHKFTPWVVVDGVPTTELLTSVCARLPRMISRKAPACNTRYQADPSSMSTLASESAAHKVVAAAVEAASTGNSAAVQAKADAETAKAAHTAADKAKHTAVVTAAVKAAVSGDQAAGEAKAKAVLAKAAKAKAERCYPSAEVEAI